MRQLAYGKCYHFTSLDDYWPSADRYLRRNMGQTTWFPFLAWIFIIDFSLFLFTAWCTVTYSLLGIRLNYDACNYLLLFQAFRWSFFTIYLRRIPIRDIFDDTRHFQAYASHQAPANISRFRLLQRCVDIAIYEYSFLARRDSAYTARFSFTWRITLAD